MGAFVIQFHGTVTHAMTASPPAIHRALFPNGDAGIPSKGVPPHHTRLYIRKNDVAKGDQAKLIALGAKLESGIYVLDLKGHEVGMENIVVPQGGLQPTVDFLTLNPHMSMFDPDNSLKATCYSADPDPKFVSGYVELVGSTIDSCPTPDDGKFADKPKRPFAKMSWLNGATSDADPILFIRPSGGQKTLIHSDVPILTIELTNDPEPMDHSKMSKKSKKKPKGMENENDFALHYLIMTDENGPIPVDDGPTSSPKKCPVDEVHPNAMITGPACSNASFP